MQWIFSVKSFDACGRAAAAEVMGDIARHYPGHPVAGNRWHPQSAPSMPRAGSTTASANRGLTNEDGSEVQLIGMRSCARSEYRQARTIRSQRTNAQYRGEFLHAFMDTEQVEVAHLPVELLRGKDRFTADAHGL